MRTKIIAGNWKMHKTLDATETFLEELSAKLPDTQATIIVAPPFVNLAAAKNSLQSSTIQIAAQNMHHEEHGAFTGEISANMLLNLQVDIVILGHSERRSLFGETDQLLIQKVKTAIAKNMKIIFCFGEGLKDRKSGNHYATVKRQLKNVLFTLEEKAWHHLILAYEPVWAIGTGETATPEQAQDMHAFVREAIAEQYTPHIANKVSILYGGSVKPKNANAIFAQPDVDGGLIGGASLKADAFIGIINALQ